MALKINEELRQYHRQKLSQMVEHYCQELKHGIINSLHETMPAEFKKSIQGDIARMQNNLGSIVLPPNTRFFQHTTGRVVVGVEQKPCMRHISYSELKCSPDRVGYNTYNTVTNCHQLSFPYVYFFFFVDIDSNGSMRDNEYSNFRVYVSPKPVNTLEDNLYYMPLPNISDCGSICFGNHISYKQPNNFKSLSEYADHCLTGFWHGVFNQDWDYRKDTVLDERLMTIESWENASKESSAFVMQAKYSRYGTAGEVMRRMGADYYGGEWSESLQHFDKAAHKFLEANTAHFIKEMICNAMETAAEELATFHIPAQTADQEMQADKKPK